MNAIRKNIVEKILTEYGIIVKKKFNILNEAGILTSDSPFIYDGVDFYDVYGYMRNDLLLDIVKGNYAVKKLPFIPKIGEIYYYVGDKYIYPKANGLGTFDKMCIKLGNCFKSEEDAEQNKEKIKEILKWKE